MDAFVGCGYQPMLPGGAGVHPAGAVAGSTLLLESSEATDETRSAPARPASALGRLRGMYGEPSSTRPCPLQRTRCERLGNLERAGYVYVVLARTVQRLRATPDRGISGREGCRSWAVVLFAGLAYWANPSYYVAVLDALTIVSGCTVPNYCFDAMSLHLYSNVYQIGPVAAEIQANMVARVGAHPIWLTETGAPYGMSHRLDRSRTDSTS